MSGAIVFNQIKKERRRARQEQQDPEDFSRFQTAQETMNTGNLLAAQKIATALNHKKQSCLCSQTQPARE